MTECYECARLAELVAENSQLRVKVDELTCNDDLAPEKVVTPEGVVANDANADTREKLEADVRELLYDVWTEGWELGSRDAMGGKDRMCDALALLDRQAAITERHILTHPDERDEQIAELQAKVDEMADKKCPGYEPENHYCRYHHQDFELNRQTVSRLKRENAELQSDYDAIIAKCAELCALCGLTMVDASGEAV